MPTIDGQPNSSLAKIGQLDPVLAAHADAIRTLAKRVVDDVIEIGRLLIECRTILRELNGHGHWYAWLKDEFRLERPDCTQLCTRLRDVQIRNALRI